MKYKVTDILSDKYVIWIKIGYHIHNETIGTDEKQIVWSIYRFLRNE